MSNLNAVQKKGYLEKAIKITEAAAGSGGERCFFGNILEETLEKTYRKMIEIAEEIEKAG